MHAPSRARWILPISTGRAIPVALHAFSHNGGVGHSTPQAPPRGLFDFTVRIAPVTFLKRSLLMNVPGSVSAGHPLEQGGSWQRRQRSASAMAWDRSNPFSIYLEALCVAHGGASLKKSISSLVPRGKGSHPLRTSYEPNALREMIIPVRRWAAAPYAAHAAWSE